MSYIVGLFEDIINWLYAISNDYGIAIVIITIGVRLILLPLNIRQRKSAERQNRVSREAEEIKKKHVKNKEIQERELARLYSENGYGLGGCLPALLQIPVMICLYNAIRRIAIVGCGTILLPWISSLLLRDQLMILPAATVIIQLLPQLYPYMSIFSGLKLQKQSGSVIVSLTLVNSIFTFMIPSGVGLYYLVSGLFQALEQFIYNLICVRRMKAYDVA